MRGRTAYLLMHCPAWSDTISNHWASPFLEHSMPDGRPKTGAGLRKMRFAGQAKRLVFDIGVQKTPDRCPIRGDLTSSLRALASAGTGHFPEGETIGWNGNAAIAMKQSELSVLMHRNHRAVLLSARERR